MTRTHRPPEADDELPAELEHPRGTLVIVSLFGLFFGLAWLATYLLIFLQRATVYP